jgi:hypothetical protein
MDTVHCSVLSLHSWTQETSENPGFVDPGIITGSARVDVSELRSVTYLN